MKEFSKEQIATFLSQTPLFNHLSTPILQEVAESCEIVYLSGENILFKQGDTADALFVLMFGFMRASRENADGIKKIIGGMSAGNIIGEIGWLINVPRTATVYAVRDSILLKISRDLFDVLLEKFPTAVMGIAKQCVLRLVSQKEINQKNNMTCFALIPAGNYKEILNFSTHFVEALSNFGKTLLLTETSFDALFGSGKSFSALDEQNRLQITLWLSDLEKKYQFIVYVSEDLNNWTYHCVRQVDRILLIGKYGESPKNNDIENFLFNENNPKTDLILLSDNQQIKNLDANFWLQNRKVSQHYCVNPSDINHINRLVRLFIGKAFGLALSGGGAPALAHIGLIRALAELKIPIDYVGGTSMGGLIGGLVALEYDYERIIDSLDLFLNKFGDKIDYTLPISGLVRGKLLRSLLQTAYGDETCIENLWIKFFCVSANLSTNTLYIHDHGLLWKAIRTTISLPAIFPPMHDENNHLLVDGGVLNNLPVDIIKDQGKRILILYNFNEIFRFCPQRQLFTTNTA